MNKTILINLKNFTLKYDMYILDESNHPVECISTTFKDLPEMIVEKCKDQNISKIILTGNIKFSEKVGNQIKEIGLTKYNLNNLDITYL